MSWKSWSGGAKKIAQLKGNKKDWFHFLHPIEKIDEMPEERKRRDAPILDDDQKRMNFEKEEQKRRAKVGRVSTMLSGNSTLG